MQKKGRNLAKKRVTKKVAAKTSIAYKLGQSMGKTIGIKKPKKKGAMNPKTEGKKVKF